MVGDTGFEPVTPLHVEYSGPISQEMILQELDRRAARCLAMDRLADTLKHEA